MEMAKSKVCTLCCGSIVSPITLACTHVFCKECVEQRLKFHYNGTATVVCPKNCDQQSRIPNDATASCLVTDIRTYVDSDAHTTCTDSRSMCHWKTCDKRVSRFCVTCHVTFCRKCWDKHLIQCRNTAPHIPVTYNYRKGEMSVVCSIHQTNADYICLNCDYKFICIYCKHRSHKGHFVEHALQSSVCLKRSNHSAIFEEKERIGMDVSEHQSGTVKECEDKLKWELKKRKLKCLRDYTELMNKKEEEILTEFCSQISRLKSNETVSTDVCQKSDEVDSYSKPLFLDISFTSPDLHDLGTISIKRADQEDNLFAKDPPQVSLQMKDTEINLDRITFELCLEIEELALNIIGGEGREECIYSVDDTPVKPNTDLLDVVEDGEQLEQKDVEYEACEKADYLNSDGFSEEITLIDDDEHVSKPTVDSNELEKVSTNADLVSMDDIHSDLSEEKNKGLNVEIDNSSAVKVETVLNHKSDNDELDLKLDLVESSEQNSVAQSEVDTNGECDLVQDNQLNPDSESVHIPAQLDDHTDHTLLNPDAVPVLNPDAVPVLNPDAVPLLNPDAVPVFFPSKTSCPSTLKSTPSSGGGQWNLNPEATPVFYPTTKSRHKEEDVSPNSIPTTDPTLARFLAAASAYSINTNLCYENDDNGNIPPETPLSTDPTLALFLERATACLNNAGSSDEKDEDMVPSPDCAFDSTLSVFLNQARNIQWRSPEKW